MAMSLSADDPVAMELWRRVHRRLGQMALNVLAAQVAARVAKAAGKERRR